MRHDQLQVWPTSDMDPNAKLNAITRLVVLLTVAAFSITFKIKFLAVGALTVLGLVVTKRQVPRITQNLEVAGNGLLANHGNGLLGNSRDTANQTTAIVIVGMKISCNIKLSRIFLTVSGMT